MCLGLFPVAELITFSLPINQAALLPGGEPRAAFSAVSLWSFVSNGIALSCPNETN